MGLHYLTLNFKILKVPESMPKVVIIFSILKVILLVFIHKCTGKIKNTRSRVLSQSIPRITSINTGTTFTEARSRPRLNKSPHPFFNNSLLPQVRPLTDCAISRTWTPDSSRNLPQPWQHTSPTIWTTSETGKSKIALSSFYTKRFQASSADSGAGLSPALDSIRSAPKIGKLDRSHGRH